MVDVDNVAIPPSVQNAKPYDALELGHILSDYDFLKSSIDVDRLIASLIQTLAACESVSSAAYFQWQGGKVSYQRLLVVILKSLHKDPYCISWKSIQDGSQQDESIEHPDELNVAVTDKFLMLKVKTMANRIIVGNFTNGPIG